MTHDRDVPPCSIHIDKEGRWFHKGVEMIKRDLIRLFYQHMVIDSTGRYLIKWGRDLCYVEVEDTAFFVRRVIFENRARVDNSRFILYLNDDTREDLFPDTLFLGNDHVLYCMVKNRTFPARFDRPAYYQLAEYIEEEDEKFFLPFNGRKYMIL